MSPFNRLNNVAVKALDLGQKAETSASNLMESLSSLTILVIIAVSSVAGWANLIWRDEGLPLRKIIAGVVLSGAAGFICYLLLFEPLKDQPTLLTGAAIVMGIGGASTIDFILVMIRKKFLRR